MPYIICREADADGGLVPPSAGGGKGLADRAFHPEEVNASSALVVDTEYYLAQQVGANHTSVQRKATNRSPAVLCCCTVSRGHRCAVLRCAAPRVVGGQGRSPQKCPRLALESCA